METHALSRVKVIVQVVVGINQYVPIVQPNVILLAIMFARAVVGVLVQVNVVIVEQLAHQHVPNTVQQAVVEDVPLHAQAHVQVDAVVGVIAVARVGAVQHVLGTVLVDVEVDAVAAVQVDVVQHVPEDVLVDV